MKILERLWPYLYVGAILVLIIGCTEAQRQAANSAATDEIVEHGPRLVETAASGDWIGFAVTLGTAIVGGIGGYFIYKRKQKKNAK